ncbi:CBS domain-containing protein [Halorubrum kocurii]|uniref:Putative signal transduction protein n=1 Tax=Halorubrum kocurii JCM 14978 TaxID=1230456 RepID=M0P725_9EURY|nr:CBS domain-containing protein [Halorubrum kocurii]EMA65861.1 putative signal transduction protein [Halorubrum kocurii JCM 14978]
MEITDIVSTEYVKLPPDAPVSKLVGTFDDPSVAGVVVYGEKFEGVVTRRQLASSHHQPDQKLKSVVWNVPRVTPDEDVRRVARLMIDGGSRLLPVFDDDELIGVVTADDLLENVKRFLDAATVDEAYSPDAITIEPRTSVGEALNVFRENRITHIPVVEDDTAVGILSLYDVMDLTVRSAVRSQGGDAGDTQADTDGTAVSDGRTQRGGFGAREGELARVIDLPVRDVMASPVRAIAPDRTLETAVEELFEIGASSLVVERDGELAGIVTKTDILDSLTWEADETRAVQVYNADLLDDVEYGEIVEMIEKFDDRDHGMEILDAKVHLHKHDEKLRGTPLLLARIRLHTDQGLYIASAEGYGASHALNQTRDALERQIRDKKTYGRNKKPRNEEFWEKRFGWILEGAE